MERRSWFVHKATDELWRAFQRHLKTLHRTTVVSRKKTSYVAPWTTRLGLQPEACFEEIVPVLYHRHARLDIGTVRRCCGAVGQLVEKGDIVTPCKMQEHMRRPLLHT